MALALRSATAADVPAIVGLKEELDRFYGVFAFEADEQRSTKVHEALFGDSAMAKVLLAWDDTDLVGMAAYSLLWPASGVTRSLFLKELFVRDRWRGRGVGRRLMEELRRTATELGCSRMDWTADIGNVDAQHFYERLGFERLPSKIYYRS